MHRYFQPGAVIISNTITSCAAGEKTSDLPCGLLCPTYNQHTNARRAKNVAVRQTIFGTLIISLCRQTAEHTCPFAHTWLRKQLIHELRRYDNSGDETHNIIS